MLRHTDCQRYRQWKEQQDALLKGPKRKPKKKSKKDRKEITDCIEEEKKEKPKTVLKISYRKCKQEETRKPKQGPSFKPKPVSAVDLLLRRIQPSMEVRHKFLAHRHAECFAETVPQIDVTPLGEVTLVKTTGRKIKKTGPKRKRSRRRKKDKTETTTSEEEKVAKMEEETVNEEETAEEAEEAIEEKEEDDAKAVDEKDGEKEVKRKNKDKFWCRKLERKIEPESEDSECDSICSFDSHICLKGLALTAQDKKKIEENRRQVQASSAA